MLSAIPTAEELNSKTYTFSDNEYNVVSIVMHDVEDKIGEVQMFNYCDQTTKEHIRYTVFKFIQWFVNKCSRFDGTYFYVPFSDHGECAVYVTHRLLSFMRLTSDYVIFNLSTNGILTECWEPVQIDFIIMYAQPIDIVIYPVDINSMESNGVMSNLLESTFEENREQTLDRIFGEHNNHTLCFSAQPPVPRTDDNSECQLCCSPSDYICSKCNEPLCCSCILHIKKSTNTCPACRASPIVLQQIEGGKRFSTWLDEQKPKPANNQPMNANINANSNQQPAQPSSDK